MRAAVPGPTRTTSVSIAVISLATSGETTRWVADGGVSTERPLGSMTALTTFGATYTPSLAIVLYAAASCMAVTAMPCPIGTVAIVVPDQCRGSCSNPG